MKAKIHPQYHQAVVTCACGNSFTVGSTKPVINIEICAKCHPFFTGEMKYVDVMGRVEKFQKKQSVTAGQTYVNKKQKAILKKKAEDEAEAATPKSLKEMLDKIKSK